MEFRQHSLSRLLRALNRKGKLVPNSSQFHKRWFASTGVLLIKVVIAIGVGGPTRHHDRH